MLTCGIFSIEGDTRKDIFRGILAVPTTSAFLYVLVVFSLVVGFGAIWMNLIPISIHEARCILGNVRGICRRWLCLGGRIGLKRTTTDLSLDQPDMESNSEGRNIAMELHLSTDAENSGAGAA